MMKIAGSGSISQRHGSATLVPIFLYEFAEQNKEIEALARLEKQNLEECLSTKQN
jgi:hypothetical protein